MRTRLGKLGVVVTKDDAALKPRNRAGAFQGFKDGSAKITLRSDPTRYELLHELAHYEHFKSLGFDKYNKLGRVKKEQYVYDSLRTSHHWCTLTNDERIHAAEYIRRVGGVAW